MIVAPPAVLSLSGHDPSGGAGIQADIEAIISHQCYPVNIITSITCQNSQNIAALLPQSANDLAAQANLLSADIAFNAIKIGLIGHVDLVAPIKEILARHRQIPVVLDPVLASGGGMDFSDHRIVDAINGCLLPHVTLLTPNSLEARRLSGMNDLHDAGLDLLAKGCEYVLITGTHESTTDVENLLFHSGECVERFSWPRLPHSYHGSGCTLAASAAALLAQGLSMPDAVEEAQEYTWETLANAFQPGKGQFVPNRLYWVAEE